MTDLVALKAANAKRWADAKLTRGPDFAKPAAKAFANKARYSSITKRAGMPEVGWLFIACAHYRESNQDFSTNLGQGDPLSHATTHVPAGRGPFLGPTAFEDGAVDALVNCAPYAARLTDWSIAGLLTNEERYNGLKYANGNRPSPYVWSGTTIYDPPTGPGGKVLVDHGPIENVTDKQLGVAGLILAIMALDPTIKFDASPSIVPDINAVPLTPSADVLDAVWLQTSLNKLGTTPVLDVDGVNGAGTRTAVRAFQTSKGLTVDGLAGPATIAAIKAALAEVPVIPKLPEIKLPPPGQVRVDLAPTFWGRVANLFKPKGT
jgi:lysozyme family protein